MSVVRSWRVTLRSPRREKRPAVATLQDIGMRRRHDVVLSTHLHVLSTGFDAVYLRGSEKALDGDGP
ncbi:hypothetical protein GWI33_015296 [Rhynchophorus ferrugineus]|uniref:Uncharacterized protein n=1 Tax=Rhynchophorus ferrugineus TaxID=354439 RepID=A0A834HZM7_RHYFE|nr:hypothetical protein GWI33_015296 [Rhynchophorus ferrugineus]